MRFFWFNPIGVLLLAAATAAGADPKIDLRAWQELPVYHRGRIMPLDTFAREAVRTICGRERPELGLAGSGIGELGPEVELAQSLHFPPEGRTRKISASELLLSWIAQPERWEKVPFLHAEHPKLRELLSVPIRDQWGGQLKYVSPQQVLAATRFREYLFDLEERQRTAGEGSPADLVGIDKKAKALADGYSLFRLLTLHSSTAASQQQSQLREALTRVVQHWVRLQENLEQFARQSGGQPPAAIAATEKIMHRLAAAVDRGDDARSKVDELLVSLEEQAGKLADLYRGQAQIPAGKRSAPAEDVEESQRTQTVRNLLASKTDDLMRRIREAHRGLYDSRHSLRLVTALEPEALEAQRNMGDDVSPWLGIGALRFGSAAFLAAYPQAELKTARAALEATLDAYRRPLSSESAAAVSESLGQLSASLRAFGDAIEPLRQALPLREKDEAALAATAYPPPGFTWPEAHYNRLDPFRWSWILDLAAVVCFGLAFGILRNVAFWLGALVLLAGQVMAIYGFGLRGYITGWLPVTGMFETVIFVALVSALMGLWFALVPLVWPGLRWAWAASALPLTWETRPIGRGRREKVPGGLRWLLAALRVALGLTFFYFLAIQPVGADQRTYFALWPRTDVGSSLPNLNNFLTWLVGWAVLLPLVWYVPRAILTAIVALPAIPARLAGGGLRRAVAQVNSRRVLVVVGGFMAFGVAFLAWWSPLWQKDIGGMAAVLRDNFWLTLHVLTITASYSAGALALGLGNIALFYYLFGRYQDPVTNPQALSALGHRPARGYRAPPEALHRRAPPACAPLAGFIYRASQVAVLLLAVGTILGALWADVAWGRFWSWDAKEVWALISLLVYLAILHGRYAGWFGNFGLVAGAVLGATAIIMAWYGVNYVFPSGRHSYASGAGGQWEVLACLGADWAFLGVAAIRYRLETTIGLEKPLDPPSASNKKPAKVAGTRR